MAGTSPVIIRREGVMGPVNQSVTLGHITSQTARPLRADKSQVRQHLSCPRPPWCRRRKRHWTWRVVGEAAGGVDGHSDMLNLLERQCDAAGAAPGQVGTLHSTQLPQPPPRPRRRRINTDRVPCGITSACRTSS